MTNITAQFIGQDGSLGYKQGETYTLYTETRPSEIFPDKRMVIYFERQDGSGAVEYEHFDKGVIFNWKNISAGM